MKSQKRRAKKLQLHRESIRHLSSTEVRQVAGGKKDTCVFCVTECFSGCFC